MELNGLKEDYKKSTEDLKLETYARNNAETLAKVLKDTLTAKEDIEKKNTNDEMEIDDSIEGADSEETEWRHQRRQRKEMKKRSRGSSESDQGKEAVNCDICSNEFESKAELAEHRKGHATHACSLCDNKYMTKSELIEHEQIHIQKKFICVQCTAKFALKRDLNAHTLNHNKEELMACKECDKQFHERKGLQEHVKIHVRQKSQSSYNCKLCDKVYGDMKKLRRHDWRSHRSIQCTICDEKLESRQVIAIDGKNIKCSEKFSANIIQHVLMKMNAYSNTVIQKMWKMCLLRFVQMV